MKQELIWEYYQSEMPESFSASRGRLAFLASKVKAKGKVLNIGVGGGIFEEEAIKRNLDVFSLDPSESTIKILCKRLGIGDKAVVGYSQNMPFSDETFDAVVISEVIEHLSNDDVEKTLREIRRVLVTGGRLIGTVPAREDLKKQIVVCPECGVKFHRWGHVQSFEPDIIKTLIQNSGFLLEEIIERPFINWPSLNFKGRLTAVIKVVFNKFGIHSSDETICFWGIKQ